MPASGAGPTEGIGPDDANHLAATYAGIIPVDDTLLSDVGAAVHQTSSQVASNLSVVNQQSTSLLQITYKASTPQAATTGARAAASLLAGPSPVAAGIVPSSLGIVSLPPPSNRVAATPAGKKSTVAIGAVLGLILGVILLVAWERSDPHVVEARPLSNQFGCPATPVDRLSPEAAHALTERWASLTDHVPARVALLPADAGSARQTDEVAELLRHSGEGVGYIDARSGTVPQALGQRSPARQQGVGRARARRAARERRRGHRAELRSDRRRGRAPAPGTPRCAGSPRTSRTSDSSRHGPCWLRAVVTSARRKSSMQTQSPLDVPRVAAGGRQLAAVSSFGGEEPLRLPFNLHRHHLFLAAVGVRGDGARRRRDRTVAAHRVGPDRGDRGRPRGRAERHDRAGATRGAGAGDGGTCQGDPDPGSPLLGGADRRGRRDPARVGSALRALDSARLGRTRLRARHAVPRRLGHALAGRADRPVLAVHAARSAPVPAAVPRDRGDRAHARAPADRAAADAVGQRPGRRARDRPAVQLPRGSQPAGDAHRELRVRRRRQRRPASPGRSRSGTTWPAIC